MLKKKLLIVIYTFLLSITVSFAWILNPESNISDSFFVQYGGDSENTLVIAPKDVEMIVYAQKSGKWLKAGSSSDKIGETEIFAVDPNTVIPNSSVPFRIRLKNNSNGNIKLRVVLTGIVCDKNLVADEIIYVSALGSMEYSKYSVNPPENVYLSLNTDGEIISYDDEANTATYNIVLYDEIEVPVTGEDGYVELDCYFYFDKDRMTNVCQNKTFYISSFRGIQ